MIDAIALQTLRGTADPEALENFSQRIRALSRAHDILLQETWTAAPLKAVPVEAPVLIGFGTTCVSSALVSISARGRFISLAAI